MKKITSTDLIVYICLIISSIIAPILMHFLNLDENNMVLGLSTIAAGFAYFGLFCVTIYLGRKESLLAILISEVPGIVYMILFGNSETNKMLAASAMLQFIFFCCYVKEYYNIFFTKDYKSEREKRDENKELAKIQKENMLKNNSKYNEFKFDTSESSELNSSAESSLGSKKKIRIVDLDKILNVTVNGVEYTLQYGISKDSNGMLLCLGNRCPDFIWEDGGEYYGDDDTSCDYLSIHGDHAIIEEGLNDTYWYFKMSDLKNYGIKEVYNSDGQLSSDINIVLQDDTQKSFGGFFVGDEYLEDFLYYMKTKYPDLKRHDIESFENIQNYEINDSIHIKPVYNSDESNFDSNWERIISFPSIYKYETKNDNTIILHLKNGITIELYKPIQEFYDKLLATLKNNNQ